MFHYVGVVKASCGGDSDIAWSLLLPYILVSCAVGFSPIITPRWRLLMYSFVAWKGVAERHLAEAKETHQAR